MALASLIPHHVFGLQASLKDVLHFVDETTVIYPAGHNLVFWDTDQRTQKIISGSPETDGISAVALSPNKKQVAIAERVYMYDKMHRASTGDNRVPFVGGDVKGNEAKTSASLEMKYPVINVYDTSTLKKKKVLAGSEVGAREYVSLSFTSDGKMIAAQGGRPDWNLLVWSLEKQKVIATAKASYQGTEAFQVQCCPANPFLITVIGVGFARTFRATDSALRPVSTGVGKRENQTFLCHTWLTDRSDSDSDNDLSDKDNEKIKDGACIYALNSGELLYVDGGEILASIAQGEAATETIVQYSKGFVCGEATGLISIYDKQEGDEVTFRKVQTIKVDKAGGKICSLAISPNEDILICAMDNNQLLMLPFQNLDMFKQNEIPKDLIIQVFSKPLQQLVNFAFISLHVRGKLEYRVGKQMIGSLLVDVEEYNDL